MTYELSALYTAVSDAFPDLRVSVSHMIMLLSHATEPSASLHVSIDARDQYTQLAHAICPVGTAIDDVIAKLRASMEDERSRRVSKLKSELAALESIGVINGSEAA